MTSKIPQTSDSVLRVSYYEASDGPRVMIIGTMQSPFAELRSVFNFLSRQSGSMLLLSNPVFNADDTISEIKLVSRRGMEGDNDSGVCGLRVKSTPVPSFEWCCTAEQWEYLSRLIDGFLVSAKPCHQYLTEYPRDDAIVVVSKGEY